MPPKPPKARSTNNSRRAQASADVVSASTEGGILDGLLGQEASSAPMFDVPPPSRLPSDSEEEATSTQLHPPTKKKKTSKSSSKSSSSKASSSTEGEPKRKVAVPRAKDHEKVARNLESLKGLSASGVVGGAQSSAKSDLNEDLLFVQRTDKIKDLFNASTYKLEEGDSDAVKLEKLRLNGLVTEKAWGFMEKNIDVSLAHAKAVGDQQVINMEVARTTLVNSHNKSKNDSFKMVSSKMLVDLAHGNNSDIVSMGTGTSAIFMAKTVNNIVPTSLPLALMDEMNDTAAPATSPTIEDITDSQYE